MCQSLFLNKVTGLIKKEIFLWILAKFLRTLFLQNTFELSQPLCQTLKNIKKTSYRTCHQRCSVKKGVLRDFTKLTGKQLCRRLFFNKVADLRPANWLKKSLWHRCFPVNFAEFLRKPFLQNTFGQLFL